jgi:two-component system, chemotaxis family, chemotaxis protein CheY
MPFSQHPSVSKPASRGNEDGAAQPRKPLRILYAEDMPELRDVARISLERDGHVVECVEDGALALEFIEGDSKSFDLVITDHHMPKLNGLELVAQLRARGFPGKIMIFTSELDREIHGAYQRLSVDRMLFKPVFPSMLRQIVAELCQPVLVGSQK